MDGQLRLKSKQLLKMVNAIPDRQESLFVEGAKAS
jgi:hypothetical protein